MLYFPRIVFAGTPDFAARHLSALIYNNYNIIGVLTKPDKISERGKILTKSFVKKLANKHNLPVFQPESLYKKENYKILLDLKVDIIVVVAYGLLLPQEVLEIPRLGCINVHGSLLPRWRGAAPIQRALLSGDENTGITIIQMDIGLDTGAILYKTSCDIQANDTSATLYEKLAYIGSEALLTTINKIITGKVISEPQKEHQATYAHKITKAEAKLNWFLPAKHLERCIRAFNPWPISYFFLSGKLIKVWSAHAQTSYLNAPGTVLAVDKTGIYISTCNGTLILTSLQFAGKKVVSVFELLNSHPKLFFPGMVIK